MAEVATETKVPRKRRTREEIEAAGEARKPTKRVVFYKAVDKEGNTVDVKIDFLKFMTMRDGLSEFVNLQKEFGADVKFAEFML